jgi:hypothetical protein
MAELGQAPSLLGDHSRQVALDEPHMRVFRPESETPASEAPRNLEYLLRALADREFHRGVDRAMPQEQHVFEA